MSSMNHALHIDTTSFSPFVSRSASSSFTDRRLSNNSFGLTYDSDAPSRMTTKPSTPTCTQGQPVFINDNGELDASMTPAAQASIAYSAPHFLVLRSNDTLATLPNYPSYKQNHDFWASFPHMEGPAGHSLSEPDRQQFGSFTHGLPLPNESHSLSNHPGAPASFTHTSNFPIPSYVSHLAPPPAASPETVSPAQVYDAVSIAIMATPRRALAEPFNTPIKEETWSLSPTDSLSINSSRTALSLHAPSSPTPVSRNRPSTRDSAWQTSRFPPDDGGGGDDEDDDIKKARVHAVRDRYKGVINKEYESGQLPCGKMWLDDGVWKPCEKRFRRSEHRNRHHNSGRHKEEKTHKCPIADCPALFDRADNCRSHIDRHFNMSCKARQKQRFTQTEAVEAGYAELYADYLRREDKANKGKAKRRAKSVGSAIGAGTRSRSRPRGAEGAAARRARKMKQRLKQEG